MRTISTMLFMTWICLGMNAQSPAGPGNSHPEGPACLLTYVDNAWTIAHSDTLRHHCQTIAIGSLPAMNQANTPMNLFISTMGTYALKKSPDLQIPEEYTVLVEDLLTGQYYNLKSPEPYTFKMNRGFNQPRFVLEISKTSSKVASAGK